MSSARPSSQYTRNYPALFLALDEVLEALDEGTPDDDALRRSFDGSADGFGAEKAVLLSVEAGGKLAALASRGLAPEEVAACERGLSVPGVSSSCIRDAISTRVPVLVQDPGKGLEAEVLAVFYVQNEGIRNAFGEIDRSWIEVYARALGRVLARRR
jgi:hypothetical protein